MTESLKPKQYIDEIGLIELIIHLWKEKRIIIVSVATILYLAITPVTYTVQAQLKKPSLGDLANINSTFGVFAQVENPQNIDSPG